MIDAIVVGAGLSGLVCARRLADAGAEVRVIEAQDRVGGRTLSARCGDAIVDLGGQWMSPGQPRLARLAAELGIATYPQRRDGAAIVALGDDDGPRRLPGKLFAALGLWRSRRALDRLVRDPDPALDARSLADWLDEQGPAARTALALHAELTFAAAPADLSLFHYVTALGATGGLGDADAELPGGGREHRLAGGTQALSERLAASLGGRIALNAPVRAIDDHGDHVTVDGAPARRAVLAVPPALARAIAVTPRWPDALARHAAASRPGAVVKLVLAYERAFWHERGLSGEAYQARGLVRAVVDLTDPASGQPALCALIVADDARTWRDDRRDAAIAELAALFGDEAAAPIDVVVRDWGRDPWSAGCVASLPPGHGVLARAWRGPHGRIHLAGTERADAWPGYLEGAIESGERAAAELLDPDPDR